MSVETPDVVVVVEDLQPRGGQRRRTDPRTWRLYRDELRDGLLAGLFLVISARYVLAAWTMSWFGLDARIYYRGSAAWLAGASPWDAVAYFADHPAHYSALPTTAVILAPFTILPEQVFVALSILASAVAAVYVIRALHLPWFFLLFPPLVQGVESGNPNIVLLALLLTGRPVVEGLAPMLKVYAGIPLLLRARWRSTAWAVAYGTLTLLAVPLWIDYVTTLGDRNARLMAEAFGGFSAVQFGPAAVLVTLVAVVVLWWRDREAGAWLAVPALWPASQFHYAILALPVIGRHWWLAALLALPVPGLPALAPALVLLVGEIGRMRKRRLPPIAATPRAGEHA